MEITPGIWDKHVVVLQETFLLLQWIKNVLRCFGRWFARRLSRVNVNHHSLLVIDVIVREQTPGVWVWMKEGRKKYNREAARRENFIDDLDAARYCIKRSCQST